MRLKSIAALAVLLLMAACVPATSVSSSVRMPVALGTDVIEVSPGESLYLLSVHTLEELGFRDSDMDILHFVNETAQRASARASNWTSVSPIRLPAWWEVSLDTARIVSDSSGRGARHSVQAVIRIDVPVQAALGPVTLRVSLDGRRESVPLTIQLRVRQQPG